MTITISKITRVGQITLPKKIRGGRAFVGAHAVTFEDRGNEVVVRPLRHEKAYPAKKRHDHLSVVEHTMRDWSDTAHDDLFEVPAA